MTEVHRILKKCGQTCGSVFVRLFCQNSPRRFFFYPSGSCIKPLERFSLQAFLFIPLPSLLPPSIACLFSCSQEVGHHKKFPRYLQWPQSHSLNSVPPRLANLGGFFLLGAQASEGLPRGKSARQTHEALPQIKPEPRIKTAGRRLTTPFLRTKETVVSHLAFFASGMMYWLVDCSQFWVWPPPGAGYSSPPTRACPNPGTCTGGKVHGNSIGACLNALWARREGVHPSS